jgi:hypothetical protein
VHRLKQRKQYYKEKYLEKEVEVQRENYAASQKLF